jgi:threonine/homoserine/homoserine lactone efflux protein
MRQQVFAFIAITIPLVLTPGAATTLVLRSSLIDGAARGYITAVGAGVASCGYGLASGLGTSMLLRLWPHAVPVLQIGGGVYLAWLGITALAAALRRFAVDGERPIRTGFRQGFLANALNPPVALFYFLIVPGFIPMDAPVLAATLLLTLIHVTLAFTWHATCATAAGVLSHVLSSPSGRRAIDLVAGVVLIAFAVRMLAR